MRANSRRAKYDIAASEANLDDIQPSALAKVKATGQNRWPFYNVKRKPSTMLLIDIERAGREDISGRSVGERWALVNDDGMSAMLRHERPMMQKHFYDFLLSSVALGHIHAKEANNGHFAKCCQKCVEQMQ